MSNKIILSPKAPKPIGPYSQAVEAHGFIFTSGTIPLDAVTGELIGGDVKTQTEVVLKNIEAVLAAAKVELKHIVKTTVYMTDLTYFAEMNEAYAAFFKENPPARTAVQVSGLPKGALIEIEAVARK
ncbi:MAG: Rid family detoxifying hydrolase [Elusimicrobia bacterium]|nr:Rid family detoxifying hydrolase [Elusimicrobiota bacterium]